MKNKVDQEGFQRALKPIRVRASHNVTTYTGNSFQAMIVVDKGVVVSRMEGLEEGTRAQGKGTFPSLIDRLL